MIEKRYITACGYVIDLEERCIVYHYGDDISLQYHKTRDLPLGKEDLTKMIDESDVVYESDDFKSCAKMAQVTL